MALYTQFIAFMPMGTLHIVYVFSFVRSSVFFRSYFVEFTAKFWIKYLKLCMLVSGQRLS